MDWLMRQPETTEPGWGIELLDVPVPAADFRAGTPACETSLVWSLYPRLFMNSSQRFSFENDFGSAWIRAELQRMAAYAGDSRHFGSATAVLLDDLGFHSHADALSSAVDRWQQQRMWSFNNAPEMVLHDASHSQAVDRHIADLAVGLLGNPTGELSPEELYAMGVAAWLHDLGHAGYRRPGSTHVSFPQDVRDLHGLMSGQYLYKAWEGPLFGTEHRMSYETRDLTRVLAQHHQGWTSSDGRPPDPETSRAKKADYYGFAAEPLIGDEESDPRRKQMLVALFRIADAADVGCHRTPHYEVFDNSAAKSAEVIRGLAEFFSRDGAKISGLEDVARYEEHCDIQKEYAEEHDRIKCVELELSPSAGNIIVHVTPRKGLTPSDQTRALGDVQGYLLREVDGEWHTGVRVGLKRAGLLDPFFVWRLREAG